MTTTEAAKILGLAVPFTAKEAKTSYRKLALIYHPDKGGDNGNMAKLNTAYRLCAKGVSFGKAPKININGVEYEFRSYRKVPKISTVVRWFGQKMLNKLAVHAHKGFTWRGESAEWLCKRLGEEILELIEVLNSGDREKIINECADVANFAMFIADKAEKQL